MTLERLVTAKELAELLGTRLNTIYDLAATGELPSMKVPGVGRRFRESEVTAWLEGCRSGPARLPQEMREPGSPGLKALAEVAVNGDSTAAQ